MDWPFQKVDVRPHSAGLPTMYNYLHALVLVLAVSWPISPSSQKFDYADSALSTNLVEILRGITQNS